MRRVVITGIGVVSPFGYGAKALMDGFEKNRSAVRYMEGWDIYKGMRSHVGAPSEMKDEKKIPREKRRSMGVLSIFAVQAAEQALADADIPFIEIPRLRTGCVVGSTMGSAKSITEVFETMLPDRDLGQLGSSLFFQCMSHTASANVAQYLELNGYIMSTAAACASALHALGVGYDLIRTGRQDIMLCGGAEELHPTVTGSFDVLFATSSMYNQRPHMTPRPFDRDRDGLVCGDGSGILLLEDLDRALSRGAKIYAEVVGYSTGGNGSHVSQSNSASMVRCMKDALNEAGLEPGNVDYVNAHATATIQGDKEESDAIRELFGDSVPVSSLKGHIGHTLGASGAIELIASLLMMERSVIYPTLNLENIDPECDGIMHVREKIPKDIRVLLKNGFAFGGINATIACRKYEI
jgi:3-oxoacyl-[acyl-carrier-protein] synthase II